jgi:hypothetical protein
MDTMDTKKDEEEEEESILMIILPYIPLTIETTSIPITQIHPNENG